MSNADQEQGTCPFLRWAGSKRQSLSRLAVFWNASYERYVEPFAGSATLFFRLGPRVALLADKNRELIEAYRVLRRSPEELHARIAAMPSDEATYYRFRSDDPAGLSSLNRAARFIYLNRYCFNGIFRTNQEGRFNVPYAGTRTAALPTVEQFRECARLLQNAELRAWDFGTTLRHVRKGDFVYLDPPYVVRDRRVFAQYGPFSFSGGDIDRLRKHLERVDAKGATFVLSYADCAEARKELGTWSAVRIAVRRHIAGFASARRRSYEVLITNATNGGIGREHEGN